MRRGSAADAERQRPWMRNVHRTEAGRRAVPRPGRALCPGRGESAAGNGVGKQPECLTESGQGSPVAKRNARGALATTPKHGGLGREFMTPVSGNRQRMRFSVEGFIAPAQHGVRVPGQGEHGGTVGRTEKTSAGRGVCGMGGHVRERFYTPQDYKEARPLQTVFMSTGLVSKQNRPRGGAMHPPETPCKRPVVFDMGGQGVDTSFSSQEESLEGIDMSFLYNSSSSEFDCPVTPTKGVFVETGVCVGGTGGGEKGGEGECFAGCLGESPREIGVFEDTKVGKGGGKCMSVEQSPQWVGELRTRFRKVELVGSGEFSEVYRVEGEGSVRSAVKKTKFAYSGSKERSRRLEEVSILRKLGRHEHVVELLDSWEQSKYLYIQMELCDNGSLDVFLQEYGRVARLDEFRVWKGLEHIHDSGYVHLDLKPANIFISFKGTLKIGDFGMACAWPVPVGTEREGDREYIAPEVLSSQQYDKPADIFSLGLVILEVAANIVLPQNGLSWQKLRSGDLSDAPRLSSCGAVSFAESVSIPDKQPEYQYIGHGGLDQIVKQMLAPNPLDRPTARQVLETKEVTWVNKVRKAGAIIYEGNYGPETHSTDNHDMNSTKPNASEKNTSESEKPLNLDKNYESELNTPVKTPLKSIPQYCYTPFKNCQLYSPKDFSFEENINYRYYYKPIKEDPWKRLHTTPLKEYKSFNVLSDFITEMGRILPRKETGCTAKHQRQLAKAIRRCRGIGLLSTVQRHPSYAESKRKSWPDIIATMYKKNAKVI
ncbi:hypothetical protein PMAC_003064 [Pneumocystis sp. 'macacae']|nr:hypothetical protein PMAC_003064 [Pneumocystis sp. 'macacae']